ncbi:hypothetical protein L6V77_17685 [Myxococcota bacterium]|nr:hypothetical protein [Myxococcota bacterium]
MTVSALRAAWQAERRAARRVAWALRLSAIAFAIAYLATVTILRRLDPFFLLLTAGTLISGASQFVLIERYRVPAFIARLAATGAAIPSADRAAAAALWPEVRAVAGRELAALAPRLLNADEIAALELDDVLAWVAAAKRPDWAARARVFTPVLVLVLAGIAAAAALRLGAGA